MSFKEILYSVEDGVATIMLNRPQRLNAFTMPMGGETREAILQAKDDPQVKVVVLTGAGRAFSAGAAVKDLLESRKYFARGEKSELLPSVINITGIVKNMGKPFITAINGPCVGAGMELASMSDLRIASDRAKFGMAFVRMGMIPAGGGLYSLPRIVGLAKALELVWTGKIIDAQEALRIGYVNQVVPHDELIPATRELALQLARGPSLAIGMMKGLAQRCLDFTWAEAMPVYEEALLKIGASEDAYEGPKAFLEKREPLFKGK
ncbi:MAG: enoyl-CoA hydratase/isomerase family protein [Chloroflexi bacterium]|nr:enoyl-CoA hydratase/isomerase family protein [Chloroflexota bacterium]